MKDKVTVALSRHYVGLTSFEVPKVGWYRILVSGVYYKTIRTTVYGGTFYILLVFLLSWESQDESWDVFPKVG